MSAINRNIFGNGDDREPESSLELSAKEMLKLWNDLFPGAQPQGPVELVTPEILEALNQAENGVKYMGLVKINFSGLGGKLPPPHVIERMVRDTIEKVKREARSSGAPEEVLARIEAGFLQSVQKVFASFAAKASQNPYLPIRPGLGAGFCPN